MRKILLQLIICLWLAPSFAQTFHALIYADSTEQNGRGCDRKEEFKNSNKFFNVIANTLGYAYHPVLNSAKDFTSAKAMQDINTLNVSKNDIVAFYYDGHGTNVNKDEWPSLGFRDKVYHSTPMLNALENKSQNAKMVLFITSCCNKSSHETPSYPTNIARESDPEIFESNVKNLFQGFADKKTLRICASKDGELSTSWVCPGPQGFVGSIFSITFREVFVEYCFEYHQSPSWDSIITETRRRTVDYGNAGEPNGQVYNRTNWFHADTTDRAAFKYLDVYESDEVVINNKGERESQKIFELYNRSDYKVRVTIEILSGYYTGCKKSDDQFYSNSNLKRFGILIKPGEKKKTVFKKVFPEDTSDKCYSFDRHYKYGVEWVKK